MGAVLKFGWDRKNRVPVSQQVANDLEPYFDNIGAEQALRAS